MIEYFISVLWKTETNRYRPSSNTLRTEEKVAMKSSGHQESQWISPLVKHALQPSLGGHWGSQPTLQHYFSMKHEDC